MKFHIYGKQYVALRHGQVYFEDKTQNSVALRKEQFFNLSDVIQCLDYFHLQSYPLSEKCWFHVGHYDISLSTQYSTFVFHPEAWKKYPKPSTSKTCIVRWVESSIAVDQKCCYSA